MVDDDLEKEAEARRITSRNLWQQQRQQHQQWRQQIKEEDNDNNNNDRSTDQPRPTSQRK